MARIDHWPKNAFMFLGVLIAVLHRPALLSARSCLDVAGALVIACIVASSNYVLNEYLDAPLDRLHPTKRHRPAAQGLVRGWIALLVWGGLGALGIFSAFSINAPFAASAYALWLMGCAYNIPPVRSKDLPYVDVLTESLNNPIRLFLGWFALVPDTVPPISLAIAYWMVGAFLMAAKRYAEYRRIGDSQIAARYRRSFRHYDEPKLLGSMVLYAVTGAVFAGIFILRYKPELVFVVPLVAVFCAYYTHLATRQDSPVQSPEKLYTEPAFVGLTAAVVVAFVLLMFVDMPVLYELFNVEPAGLAPLWRIGG